MPGRELYRTFNSIPTARTDFPTELDQNHPAVTHDDPIGILVQGYGKLRGSDDESFPCPLQTSQHGQIGAEIVAGGCLDVAVTELSCDH